MKVKNDHRSKFSYLSNWKEQAWKKKSGLQRDSNPWPPRCRCVALPTELWSHTLGTRPIYLFHFTPHGRYELNKLTSLPMCGIIAQLVEQRTGNAGVTGSNPFEDLFFFFFQASSFQLFKLENLLRWSFFTFINSIVHQNIYGLKL